MKGNQLQKSIANKCQGIIRRKKELKTGKNNQKQRKQPTQHLMLKSFMDYLESFSKPRQDITEENTLQRKFVALCTLKRDKKLKKVSIISEEKYNYKHPVPPRRKHMNLSQVRLNFILVFG